MKGFSGKWLWVFFFSLMVSSFCLVFPGSLIAEEYGSISGTVYEADGVTPFDQSVSIQVIQGDPCEHWETVSQSNINPASGEFTLFGVPAGQYFLRIGNTGSTNAVENWWSSTGSSIQCSQAEQINLSAGQEFTGLVVTSGHAGSISGTVTENDGGTPVQNIHIYVDADACRGGRLSGANTDENGNYTLMGIPPGTVYVKTWTGGSDPAFINQIYDGDTGTLDCEQALGVPVTAGETTTEINFQLAAGVTVSGRVTDTLGNPIPNLWVHAFDDLCGGNGLGGISTDDQGYYTTAGLPPGDVYIEACPACNNLNYLNNWWTGTGNTGSTDCGDAQNLNLQAGVNAADIDFQLEQTASVSGTVFESDGTTPIQGLRVYARVSACDGQWFGNMDTDENGNYTISGLPGGTVFVGTCGTCNENNLPFIDATWDGGTGSRDCNQGVGVEVTAGETTAGIDFNLETGVRISGRVTDTQGNPVPDLWLHAFDQACGGTWLGGGRTDEQGNYTTAALPAGNVYIEACPRCDDFQFNNSWWTGTDSPGSTNCNDARNLNLQADAEDIDFILEYPIFVEINMSHRPEDSFSTWYGIYFFNFDNFDLDSVVSITMSGPSGSPVYQYTREDGDDNDFVKNQWNGFHVSTPGVQPKVGPYTFDVVTDDFSTTVTHIRRANKTLPLVDAGTMSPADGSMITSTIPVFEWGAIEDPPMPVYYRLQVYDDTGYRIYASQRMSGLRSVALPENLFEPGRTYTWHVSVYDTYDGNLVENASHTESSTFTMANPLPNSHASPPAIDLDGWGTVSWRRSNMDATSMYIKVIDHDGIANDGSSHQVSAILNGETYSLYHVRSDSAYEAYYEYWDAENPAPAGDYIFTATDPEGNTGSLTDTLVVNHLPIFDQNTFAMIPNGTSPTLSWDSLTGAVRYRIRIYDSNWNRIFHGYPRTQPDMTYTLPPGILQPNTQYYYRIEAWDSHSSFDTDNVSVSGNISFTTEEESVDPLVEIEVGAATRNSGDQGTYLYFWTKIHDAQGVPGNIQAVTATFPDGTTIPLELDYNESSTCGIYYAEDFGLPIASGEYTIIVEDQDGNTHSVTDFLDVNPIGYPDDITVNAMVDETLVNVGWEGIDEAAFYRVEIHDMDGNRLHNLSTTQNAYTIPAGYLKKNTYQYRITTWREFFDEGINNSSRSVMKTFEIGSNEQDQQSPRQVLSGQDQAIDVTADTKIIGTGARETLNILANVNVSFTAGNGDRINLPWNRSDYTLTSAGNRLYLDDGSGYRVTLLVNGTSTVVFADGEEVELTMLFEPGIPPMVMLGENVIGN